jgi:dynein heavy chain 1
LKLAYIKLKGSPDELDETEFDFLLKGGDNISGSTISYPELDDLLTQEQQRYLSELLLVPSFKTLKDHMVNNKDSWKKFFQGISGEANVPSSWEDEQAGTRQSVIITKFRKLLLVKLFRMDRFIFAGSQFIASVFGESFMSVVEADLGEIVQSESNASSPLLLCSAPGYDSSYKVDDLAVVTKKPYKAIAIGSAEGFDMAEKAINQASDYS